MGYFASLGRFWLPECDFGSISGAVDLGWSSLAAEPQKFPHQTDPPPFLWQFVPTEGPEATWDTSRHRGGCPVPEPLPLPHEALTYDSR